MYLCGDCMADCNMKYEMPNTVACDDFVLRVECDLDAKFDEIGERIDEIEAELNEIHIDIDHFNRIISLIIKEVNREQP